jgi:perosamine synthetase
MNLISTNIIPVCEPLFIGNEKIYLNEAFETGWISSNGKFIDKFERAFAEYCGVNYAVSVVNGTAALHLALTALGIGKGSEVIIPDFTMVASAFAVCYTGAKPVFVDADPDTWNIDVTRIEEKITKKTKAIMPVSIFGLPCDMKKISELGNKYNIKIIEDAAESHGGEYQNKKTGSLADITCFSFYANKNLTTGEGGMILTNNEELYKKCKYYKNLCFSLDVPRNYVHNNIGFNYRMSNLHAAIGLAQVEQADALIAKRIRNAEQYLNYLSDVEGILLQKDYSSLSGDLSKKIHVHWMNGIVVDENIYGRTRDELIMHLKENGIDTRVFFVGMHRQPALINYGIDKKALYPVTELLSGNGFYLPSSSGLTEDEIKYICKKISEFKN